MNTTDGPLLVAASERYESWTRRLGRAAALTLALTVLLPRLWRDADGVLHVLWFWERRPEQAGSWQSAIRWLDDGFDPALALLLLISLVTWVSAKFRPLARRGRWLVVTTLVCLSVPAHLWSASHPFPIVLAGHFSWLVVAGLGLVFSGMAAYRRLGTALCAVGGLLLLGNLLWPVGDWEWPLLRMHFENDPAEPASLLWRAVIVIALALGGLLLWLGLGKEHSRVVRRLAVVGLMAVIAVAFAGTLMGSSGRGDQDTHLLEAAWNGLRWSLRPYAEALLIAVGLFAWIVGAHEERTLGSVFD